MNIWRNVKKGGPNTCVKDAYSSLDLKVSSFSDFTATEIHFALEWDWVDYDILPLKLTESPKNKFNIDQSLISYCTSLSTITQDTFKISFYKYPLGWSGKQRFDISWSYWVKNTKCIEISLKQIILDEIDQVSLQEQLRNKVFKIISHILSNKSWNTHIQDLVDEAA